MLKSKFALSTLVTLSLVSSLSVSIAYAADAPAVGMKGGQHDAPAVNMQGGQHESDRAAHFAEHKQELLTRMQGRQSCVSAAGTPQDLEKCKPQRQGDGQGQGQGQGQSGGEGKRRS